VKQTGRSGDAVAGAESGVDARRRLRDLALIHLAKAQLGLDDDTYHAMLRATAGVASAADLNAAGRARVLEHLRSRGFRPLAGARRHPASPSARYIRWLWSELWRRGEVGSREGLARWLKAHTRRLHPRRAGWARPESLPAEPARRVIRQLRAWLDRARRRSLD
jgi:phage gp16-like protein